MLFRSVEGKLFRAVDKQKDFEGVLRSFDKETIVIEGENGKEMELKRDNIALIRLHIDF